MGALSYAEDITLLSSSLRGLNKMLTICSDFVDNFDITFNSKKTVRIKFAMQCNHLNNIMYCVNECSVKNDFNDGLCSYYIM